VSLRGRQEFRLLINRVVELLLCSLIATCSSRECNRGVGWNSVAIIKQGHEDHLLLL
jgi:hypothetical protein